MGAFDSVFVRPVGVQYRVWNEGELRILVGGRIGGEAGCVEEFGRSRGVEILGEEGGGLG